MKILWFCNNPAAGLDYLYKGNEKLSGTGGWLYSLNKSLKSHVDLHVAFYYPHDIRPFEYDGTHYHPIYRNIIAGKLKKIFLHKHNNSFLQVYKSLIETIAPDVIHIHGTENPFCELIGNTEIPIVVSIQGILTVYNYKFNSGFHGRFLRCKSAIKSIKSLLFGRLSFGDDKRWFEESVEREQQSLHVP